MDALTDIQTEIKGYLVAGKCQHLADTLDLVPVLNQEAIYNMISDLQYAKAQKAIIAMQVCEDVAALVAGTPEEAVYSKRHLLEL